MKTSIFVHVKFRNVLGYFCMSYSIELKEVIIIRLNIEYTVFSAWTGGFDEILVLDIEVPRNRM